MNFEQLVRTAQEIVRPTDLNDSTSVAYVGAALLTDKGNVYTGVNLDLYCSVGFCAEHSAAAAMVTHGEFRVIKMVAVNHEGNILPPCGRCRELISQLHPGNRDCQVLVAEDKILLLSELMPFDWKQV